MSQISSVVLNHMAGLLSNMFEDFMDVLLSSRGGRAPNPKASKSQCEPPARGLVTIAKIGKEEARMEGDVEEDTNERTSTINYQSMVDG